MRIVISKTADELGMRAAEASAKIIKEAIEKNGRARIILSTGASQPLNGMLMSRRLYGDDGGLPKCLLRFHRL